ncbi:MAG: Lrp/AsnC family transcriptional regulator [Bacteroidota bacterium]
MESRGIISKYVALVDRHKLDPTIMVFCSVSIEQQGREAIKNFNKAVTEIPEVVECYVMGGNVDFLIKVIVKDLDSYYHLVTSKLLALDNVKEVKSSFVLEEAKYSTAIPV